MNNSNNLLDNLYITNNPYGDGLRIQLALPHFIPSFSLKSTTIQSK